MILYIFLSVLLSVLGYVIFTMATGRCYFYPWRNYRRWRKLNWFGVYFFTILYWIIFFPCNNFSFNL